MSRDWTSEEIQTASEIMQAAGHMGYEDFCKELSRNGFTVITPDSPTVRLKPEVQAEDK